VVLGLREGEAYAVWKELNAGSLCDFTLDAEVCGLKSTLPARDWEALALRYRLGDSDGLTAPAGNGEGEEDEEDENRGKRTLEEVAGAVGLTRERIRQIESKALSRLSKLPAGGLGSLSQTLVQLIRRGGGVTSVKHAGEMLTHAVPAGRLDPEQIALLLMEATDDLIAVHRGAVYGLATIAPAEYCRVIERARSIWRSTRVRLNEDDLVDRTLNGGGGGGDDWDERFVRACIRADGRFADARAGRDLNFLLLETLRATGRPAHYSEIADRLNASGWRTRPTAPKSVHGRLASVHHLFVYVDRGTYGLTEWGLEDKRVFDRCRNALIGDIIEDYLVWRDTPAGATEIVAHVLACKRCHDYSVRMSLSRDARFCVFARGRYGLKRWVT
jgi:hypothetical protein